MVSSSWCAGNKYAQKISCLYHVDSSSGHFAFVLGARAVSETGKPTSPTSSIRTYTYNRLLTLWVPLYMYVY